MRLRRHARILDVLYNTATSSIRFVVAIKQDTCLFPLIAQWSRKIEILREVSSKQSRFNNILYILYFLKQIVPSKIDDKNGISFFLGQCEKIYGLQNGTNERTFLTQCELDFTIYRTNSSRFESLILTLIPSLYRRGRLPTNSFQSVRLFGSSRVLMTHRFRSPSALKSIERDWFVFIQRLVTSLRNQTHILSYR